MDVYDEVDRRETEASEYLFCITINIFYRRSRYNILYNLEKKKREICLYNIFCILSKFINDNYIFLSCYSWKGE